MVEIFWVALFWFSAVTVLYAYIGYPAFLFLSQFIFKKPVMKREYEPFVSIILSAFNEEREIEKKLLNLLDLEYPEEKIEILVGSDGGQDETDQIVSRFHSTRIRFFRFIHNFGKPQVLRSLVEEAKGEILIFTDSRQEFDRQALRHLAANFSDPQVGCVSGELYFKTNDKQASVGSGMDAYWKYEKFLRKKEAQIGSMLGATGAIYAIRKRLFPYQIPADILVDDMYIPLHVIRKGYRAVFDSEAIAYDRPSEKGKQEFRRKVRTLAGNYQIFKYFPDLFHPFKSPISLQLFSHKLLRLIVPFFLVLIFMANLFLIRYPFYFATFVMQILFYGLALFEAWFEYKRNGEKGPGYIPYTFCLLNASAFMGLLRFLKGGEKASWEKAYS